MRLKLLIALLLFIIGGTQMAAAQDKIYLRNGGVIDAKVKEVAPKTITYTKKDNPDGPSFIIRKGEVESIKYANGSKDVMDDDDDNDDDDRGRDRRDYRRERPAREHRRFGLSREKYGKNILSLAPIQMTNEGVAGVGLHYERVIDKNNIISFYLPYALTFHRDEYYNGMYYEDMRSTYHHFYPGIKLYPTGSNRRVSYAVGASAVLGFGNKFLYDYTSSGVNRYKEQSVMNAGLMINNSLNVQPLKNLYIGVELGLGFNYYDDTNGDGDFYYDLYDDGPLVQFNFKIGYRF